MAREFPKLFVRGEGNPREGLSKTTSDERLPIADLCLSVGSISDALSYYRSALEKAQASSEAKTRVAIRIAECLRRRGSTNEALDFIESVISDLGVPDSSLLAEKAKLYLLLGRYSDANRTCQEALRIRARSTQADIGLYLLVGNILARMCRWTEAIPSFEHAACLASTCGDQISLGKALNNLGIIYKNLCKFEDSVRFLEKAVEIDRGLDNKSGLANSLLNLAVTLYKKGDLPKAEAAIDECLNLSSLLNLRRIRILGLICQARIEGLKGDLRKALKTITETLDAFDHSDDPRAYFVGMEVYAEVLIEKGDLKGAQSILEKVLDDLPSDAIDLKAESMVRLAIVFQRLRDLEKAMDMAEKARCLAKDLGDRYEEARALRVLGLSAMDPVRSRSLFSEAISIFENIGALLEMAITKHMLALRDRCLVDYLREALVIYRNCGARRLRVVGLCDLARNYLRQGYSERAINCIEEASSLCESDEGELVAKLRREVDSNLAKSLWPSSRLMLNGGACPDSVRLALDADGLAILRLEEGGHQIVDLLGIPAGSADALAKGVAKSTSDPMVATDPSILAPEDGFVKSLGLMVAKRISVDSIDYMVIIAWKRSRIAGADSYISLTLRAISEMTRMEVCIRRSLPRAESGLPLCFGGILTADSYLRSILLSIPKIAAGSANVLITGETGTGKELVARAIHLFSHRSHKPFVAINCAALPEHLLESELFGHKAGSFTGAKDNKPGLIESANGGTFFLDEVGDLSLSMQAKILRAIETNEIRRVGETQSRQIDVRFISATNKDLESEVERGGFRKDLYYRLDVVSIDLPPLRQRKGDIAILANLFLKRFASRMNKRISGFSDDALQAMLNYDWPGNVRQLENEVEKAVTMAQPGAVITSDLLSFCRSRFSGNRFTPGLRDEIRKVERSKILSVLEYCGWNKTKAARMLGDISRPALIAKMKRLGIPLSPQ